MQYNYFLQTSALAHLAFGGETRRNDSLERIQVMKVPWRHLTPWQDRKEYQDLPVIFFGTLSRHPSGGALLTCSFPKPKRLRESFTDTRLTYLSTARLIHDQIVAILLPLIYLAPETLSQ